MTFFRDTYVREHATTRKVLAAFPAEHAQFKPHERSNTALMLGWTFVVEERFIRNALRGEDVLAAGAQQPPDSMAGVIEAFDAVHAEVLAALDAAGDALTHKVAFFTAPKTMGEYDALQFAWLMLFDQIHHRGQLSVYLRMVGGRVPSIYGPTADEPWT